MGCGVLRDTKSQKAFSHSIQWCDHVGAILLGSMLLVFSIHFTELKLKSWR